LAEKSKFKTESIRWVSPFGVARFPKITQPDIGHAKSDGKFKVNLMFDEPELSLVREAQAAAAAKLWPNKAMSELRLPLREHMDKNKETGAETPVGWGITAKSKNRPLVMDALKNALPEGLKIGGGTVMRIGAAWAKYDRPIEETIIENGVRRQQKGTECGLTVYLNAVQIKELSQGGGKSDGSEFDSVDGGYEYDGDGSKEAITQDAADL
jgi:hypothetical protein